GRLPMVKAVPSLRKRKLFVPPSTSPATLSTLLASPMVTGPAAITPRERGGEVEEGEVGNLVIGARLFWLTEPPVTSSKLGTLAVSTVIGFPIVTSPISACVPFGLRSPLSNIPA